MQTEKTYLAIYTRIYITPASDPGWGAWHPIYPHKKYHYGLRQPYLDINSAMEVARRRMAKIQAGYINNPYPREFKIVKVTNLTTHEDV